MIINKETILAGDQNQFALLLKAHYLRAGVADSQKVPALSERVAIGRALQSQALSFDWANPDVDGLLAAIDKKFGEQAPVLQAEIRFHIQTLRYFANAVRLDGALADTFGRLNTLLLAHAIADAQFWTHDRALKKLANFLCEQMLGWDESFGVTSGAMHTLFAQTVEKLAAVELLNQDALRHLHEATVAEFHKLMDKFERLANRLKDSEIGALKAVYAKRAVARFINQLTHGKKLPVYITRFLHNRWLNEMQILLIRQGESAALWLRWKKLLETLVRFYQEDFAVGDDVVSYNIMINLSNEFEKLIAESLHPAAEFDDFCNELAYDFTQKASGRALDGLVDVPSVAVPGELPGIEKKVSATLISKAKAFVLGQWFIYKDADGRLQRCRLLFSLPEFDQLLFVTLVGQKNLILDYERFAYLLSAKLMQPLLQIRQLESVFVSHVDKLLETFEEMHEARLSLRKQKELEARKAKEEHEKQQAIEKAMAEAEAIAKRKEGEEQVAKLAQISDDFKRQARLGLNSLALGAWVDLYDENSKGFRRIKLAVKYAATGRFVFVDADGVTAADCQRDELVEMMMKRKLKLLESDSQFADRLTQIIKNIRQAE